MNEIKRIRQTWTVVPAVVVFPLLMIPTGIAAAVLGTNASRAFTNLGGDITIRAMGVALLVGGCLALWGVARSDTLLEAAGLAFIGGGATVYAVGVVLGLGKNGVIAGFGFLAIALWAFSRVSLVMRAAKQELRSE